MARRFNGTADYLEHGAAVVTAVPITMACWVYLYSRGSGRIFIAIGDGVTTRVTLSVNGTGNVVAGVTDTAAAASGATTTAVIGDEAWNHVCGVWASNTDRRVFLNGADKVMNTDARVLGSPSLTTIGARYHSSTRGFYMDGLLVHVAIWNVALDDPDALLLAQGYSPDLIRPGNLVAYWPLTGQHSPNEIDLKGRFDATVTGAKPAIADHPPMIPRSRRGRALDYGAMLLPPVIPSEPNPARIIFRHA